MSKSLTRIRDKRGGNYERRLINNKYDITVLLSTSK